MSIEFITTRELENKSGELKGKVRIIKLKEEDKAMVDFTCPDCGHSEKKEELWQEPFVTGSGANKKMNVVCRGCGKRITVLKLKKEVAKEAKKEKERKKTVNNFI
jgi:DNA-directed RNA polymerase subunit RPC12/RpoP